MLETDPPKYHHVYEKLCAIMKDYTPHVKMKSIDEGILDFHGTLLEGKTDEIVKIGYEIKERVKKEIGDYMTINVGIAPNRFLAKTAAGLHKPDGLDVIDHTNLIKVYESLELQDLNGIADGYGSRLRAHNIFTPMQFLAAQESILKRQIFRSINGTYWYKRLRGFEVDDIQTSLGMVGRQWVVKNPTNDDAYLRSCLHFLAETTAKKLRFRNMEARSVCVWLSFNSGGGFVDKKTYKVPCYTNEAIWERVSKIFDKRPEHMVVRTMGMYLYNLEPSNRSQLDLFGDKEKDSTQWPDIYFFYNKKQNADPTFGTIDKPLPILFFESSDPIKKTFWYDNVKQEKNKKLMNNIYENNVKLYLQYFIEKEDFKKLFPNS